MSAPQPADIDRVETVDILCRVNRRDHPLRLDRLGERQLHQDAVDPLIGIEPADQIEDRREIGIGRQAELEGRDPGLGAGAPLAADVDLAGRVVADQHCSETRGDIVFLTE